MQVDLFDGRQAQMGGIMFDGSARLTFWDAITRGVRKEILDQFAWVDEQARRYNRHTALESIDQSAGLLVSFARGVRRDVIAKDRILRGDGISFPSVNDAGHWHGTSEGEIRAYAEALKSAFSFDQIGDFAPNQPDGARARLNRLWQANQGWLGLLSLIIGLVGLLAIF